MQEEPQLPLPAVEVAYQAVFNATIDSIMNPSPVSEELDESYLRAWADKSTYSYDFLDIVFPSDEEIMEAMIGKENICEYLHHNSFYLPKLSNVENHEFHVRLAEGDDMPINPLPKEGVFFEGNMENISTTISLNISAKPNIVENVYIGANCSSKEVSIYTSLYE